MGNKIKKLLKTILLILSLCFTISILTACSNGGNSKISGQEQKTVKVKVGNITDRLRLSGTIVPSQVAAIKSKISGEIDKVLVHVGDSVQTGDIIAYLNPDPKISLDVLKKELNLWKKNLEFKKQERLFNEKEKLFEKKLISDEEYQECKLDYRILKKELEILKLELLIYKKENGFDSSDEQAANIQRAKIVSTITGIILQIPVQEGDFVRSALSQYAEGTVICSIGNLKEYLVETSVSEFDVQKIKTGQQVEISLNDRLEIDIGIVQNFFANKDDSKTTSSFNLKVKFTPENLECFPGMSANVDVILGIKKDVLTLPLEAVLFRSKRGRVVAPGLAGPEIIRVVIGSSDNHTVEIVSGLEENIEVYTNPSKMIKNATYK